MSIKIFSFLLVLMAFGCNSASSDQEYGLIDGATFQKLRTEKELVILDVRTAKEFQSGQIPGAINIDITAPDFLQEIMQLDKSQEFLVYCAVGGRSARARKEMQKLGFERVYDLEGGFGKYKPAQK